VAGSAVTSPAAEPARGVLGPPWQEVPALSPVHLSLDRPVARDAAALAVYSRGHGSLVRCGSAKEAALRAEIAARSTGQEACILKGCLQLASGRWYFPTVVERVDTRKVLDPLKRRDRALLAKKLSREMVRAARVGEVAQLEVTLDLYLGTQWGTLAPAQLEAVYQTTRAAIASVGTTTQMTATTTKAGQTLFGVAERSRRAKLFGIPESFTQPDAASIRRLNGNMPFFVSDDYGRRVDVFVERDALSILQGGQRLGLDDQVIGARLHTALAARVTGRTAAYFSNLSSISVVRSSTYGQLTGYKDAKIARCEWVAVMDGATCNICRFLHGEVFDVGQTLSQIQGASAPGRPPDQAIMADMPFYREFQGAIHVAPTERGGPVGVMLASVDQSAVGRDNARGQFTTVTSPQTAGATKSPPAHGLCRCLTLPVM